MSAAYRVHLQGFSPFERSALASYFRLATHRSPAYDLVPRAADAHFIVADADHATALRTVEELGRVADTVFVGAQAPAGAMAWLMRPIDPLHVLRELDALVSLHLSPAPPAPAPAKGAPAGVQRTVLLPPRPGQAPARRASDDSHGTADLPLPVLRHGGEALLVDDSEVAPHFLASRLQRFGLRCEAVTSAESALALVAKRAFDFVFVDLELGPGNRLDGYGLCQELRRLQRALPGRRPAVLSIVSAHASEVDRVRGALAGADGYLGKPLSDEALDRLMALHGFMAHPEAAEH